ncbi:hypothetical protein EYD10_01811 [Varanus komodoensis]|nr:hypothetical protein EYD10_01811 [Varanus komodoensis]
MVVVAKLVLIGCAIAARCDVHDEILIELKGTWNGCPVCSHALLHLNSYAALNRTISVAPPGEGNQSIIFIRDRNARGQEVSAYIDYAHRLKVDEFDVYFSGKKKLFPRRTDLRSEKKRQDVIEETVAMYVGFKSFGDLKAKTPPG